MYCSKCATNLPDDAIFCYRCGASTSVPASESFPLKKSRGVGSIVLIVVAVCAALALGGVLIIGMFIGIGTIGWTSVVKSGNETAAAQTIDNIRKFEAQYASRNKGNFATFDELIAKVNLDERFKGERPVVNGYVFTLTVGPASPGTSSFYSITADPQVAAGGTSTGTRHFYTDSSLSSIKATDENRPAKRDDPAL